ncbi:MAG: tetratricopeptide repeat protein [Bacteroidota bacterium]
MKADRLPQLLAFLEKAPKDSFTIYSIAYEYLSRGDVQKAENFFLRLREQDPDYLGLYYHLGKTYQQLENQKEAENVYREGMKRSQAKRDYHTFGELQRALNRLLGLDYEDEV